MHPDEIEMHHNLEAPKMSDDLFCDVAIASNLKLTRSSSGEISLCMYDYGEFYATELTLSQAEGLADFLYRFIEDASEEA